MEKLNLPIIKGKLPKAKQLSMDDYIKFISLQSRYTLNKAIYRKTKRSSSVNVHFKLVQ